MATAQVTISGGFHNVSDINLRINDGKISSGQYKRLWNHMCPVTDCICGTRHGWDIVGIPRNQFMEMLEEAKYASSK